LVPGRKWIEGEFDPSHHGKLPAGYETTGVVVQLPQAQRAITCQRGLLWMGLLEGWERQIPDRSRIRTPVLVSLGLDARVVGSAGAGPQGCDSKSILPADKDSPRALELSDNDGSPRLSVASKFGRLLHDSVSPWLRFSGTWREPVNRGAEILSSAVGRQVHVTNKFEAQK
jgi:hypothetical protein